MKPFVLRSSNGGITWSESWIDDVLPEANAYTRFSPARLKHTNVDIVAVFSLSWSEYLEFDRIGDESLDRQ